MPTIRRRCEAPPQHAWLSLGHTATPPDLKGVAAAFGPPAFTAAEQAKHPDKPLTRVLKDVLPVGDWQVEPGKWHVDLKTLNSIADNYAKAQRAGYAANLGKGHGDSKTMLIHPDDLIAPIDQALVVGSTLWIACYVTPEQAKYLSNPACKVSIGTMEPFTDGMGNTYPIQLIHVAVTDHPVVAGQGRFVALGGRITPEAAPRRVLNPERSPPMIRTPKARRLTALAKPGTMTAEELQVALQELLDALGVEVTVPAFSDATLLADFRKFIKTVQGVVGEPKSKEGDTPEPPPMLDPSSTAMAHRLGNAEAARRLAARHKRESAKAADDARLARQLEAAGITPNW